jgi:uncharacterized protein (DUF1501 family)
MGSDQHARVYPEPLIWKAVMTQPLHERQCFRRRDFLKAGSAGLLGLTLADVLRQEASAASSTVVDGRRAHARNVILVWLGGGPATIDMWDMKPDAPDPIRGDFKAISTSVAGIQICEHLPRLATVMNRCVLVRSLSHGITAHGPGAVYMATGHPPSPALEYPSLGALAARILPPPAGVPPYILFAAARAGGFQAGSGFLGAACNPLEVEAGRARLDGIALPDGFSTLQLDTRSRLRNQLDARFRAVDETAIPATLDRFQQQALDILRADRTRQALDVSREPAPVRERYGRSPFAQSVLAARRLIEAGVRFVAVGLGGWDTHANNFEVLRRRLLPQIDQPLAALIGDLDQRGLLSGTIVYCAGEFGRTPRVNSASGRDHWARAMSVFLAGGAFRRGHVHGSTDRHGDAPAADPCSPTDVAATIFHALGIEPSHQVQTATGRPLAIFRDAQVIRGLLA